MNIIDKLTTTIADPKTPDDVRLRLRELKQAGLQTYSIGQRVRIKFTDEILTIVNANAYGPIAQFYMLVHEDANWQPPSSLSVNTNYERPRILAILDDIA